jgi:hypothetical protein
LSDGEKGGHVTRTLRFAAITTVAALGLATGGSALAAYNPGLIVAATSQATGGGGPVVIGVGVNQNDDATGVVTLYSPVGYGVTLGQAPGTRLGALSGVVRVGTLGGARVNIEGTVTADNPAAHVANQCFPGVHEAVWILEFTLSGTPVRLPMYVDRITTGPEAAYASARMRICFPSAYHDPPAGAPGRASVVVAAFSVRSVFTNPGTRGSYPWHGVFVPWTPGAATPTLNPAQTAQSTSIVRLPTQLAVTAKRQRRGKRTFAAVTACLSEAGTPVRGVRVNILGGATARRARRVGFGRTNARGCITRRARVRTRFMFFRASADVPERQAPGCGPTLAPRCSEPSIAPVFDLFSRNVARVRR